MPPKKKDSMESFWLSGGQTFCTCPAVPCNIALAVAPVCSVEIVEEASAEG